MLGIGQAEAIVIQTTGELVKMNYDNNILIFQNFSRTK